MRLHGPRGPTGQNAPELAFTRSPKLYTKKHIENRKTVTIPHPPKPSSHLCCIGVIVSRLPTIGDGPALVPASSVRVRRGGSPHLWRRALTRGRAARCLWGLVRVGHRVRAMASVCFGQGALGRPALRMPLSHHFSRCSHSAPTTLVISGSSRGGSCPCTLSHPHRVCNASDGTWAWRTTLKGPTQSGSSVAEGLKTTAPGAGIAPSSRSSRESLAR